jgi:hypothetical protein
MKMPSWWPWVSKKRMAATVQSIETAHAAELQNLTCAMNAMRESFAKNLATHEKTIDGLMRRVSEIKWRREGPNYYMTLSFDPRAIDSGRGPREEREILAKHFGRQVEADIVTSRFISSAENSEFRRVPRKYSF